MRLSTIILGLLVLAIPLGLFASFGGLRLVSTNQSRINGVADPDEQLDFLANELSLTRQQQEKIGPILHERYAQTIELLKDSSLSAQTKSLRLAQIKADTAQQIRNLLSNSQIQKLKELRQEIRHRRNGGRHEPDAMAQARAGGIPA